MISNLFHGKRSETLVNDTLKKKKKKTKNDLIWPHLITHISMITYNFTKCECIIKNMVGLHSKLYNKTYKTWSEDSSKDIYSRPRGANTVKQHCYVRLTDTGYSVVLNVVIIVRFLILVYCPGVMCWCECIALGVMYWGECTVLGVMCWGE